MKKTVFLCVAFGFCSPLWAFCPNGAVTEYEKAYCQIAQKDPNISLPNAHDFQINDAKVQYLLIKRAAEKIGIKLSKPESLQKKVIAKPEVIPTRGGNAYYETKQVSTVANPFGSLSSNCQRTAQKIQCGNLQYQLRRGKAMAQLASDALSDSNQLNLERYQGQEKSGYLSQAYATYLQKMLSLGLEGKTMTFEKFSNTFGLYQDQGVDFSARFQQMFKFLKQDRKNSPGNPGGGAPSHIQSAQCYKVSQTLVVCDEWDKNYVFVLQE